MIKGKKKFCFIGYWLAVGNRSLQASMLGKQTANLVEIKGFDVFSGSRIRILYAL